MLVLGSTAASPEVTGTPATTRLSNVEPLALLAAPLAVRLLTTLATKPSAVIRPFRMLMAAAVAVLCAPASAVPNAPLVVRAEEDRRVVRVADLADELLHLELRARVEAGRGLVQQQEHGRGEQR